MTFVQQLRTRIEYALSTVDSLRITASTEASYKLLEAVTASLMAASILTDILEEEYKREES